MSGAFPGTFTTTFPAETTGAGGGWEGLLAILTDARQTAAAEAAAPPVACPRDGTPLETGPNGELHCPFDGWIWRGY